MPSTYSPSLQLELIGTGDQAGTWGTTTNTNFGTLLDQAIAGYTTQAVSTGTDTTLVMTPGASAIARNMYIELTGTGGTNTNLIVPSNEKLYFIFNNTSSGQVTVKVSGQTGVSVANNTKLILVSNGTDIINATSYVTSSGGGGTVSQINVGSGNINGLSLSVSPDPLTTTGTISLVGPLSGTATTLNIGGNAATATFATSAGSATTAGSVSGIVSTGNGGTGSSSLAGAGIPTFSASNPFTSTNGFGVSPYTGVAVFTKALSGSGTGIVSQNTGNGVPLAVATDQGNLGILEVFYAGAFPAVTTLGYHQQQGAGVVLVSSSDYRLKSNVAPLSNAITKLKQLAPKHYTWMNYPEVGVVDGFIAHELQAVIPHAVSGEKDAVDQDGKPKYQGIDVSKLVPLLTAALQEALVRIEALEAKVGA